MRGGKIYKSLFENQLLIGRYERPDEMETKYFSHGGITPYMDPFNFMSNVNSQENKDIGTTMLIE